MPKTAEILILDDDPTTLQTFRLLLARRYRIRLFLRPEDAEPSMASRPPDLAIVDLHLGNQSGLEVLERWKQRYPEVEILFCSGETQVARVLECLRRGAGDYLPKPFSAQDALFLIERALKKRQLRVKAERLSPLLSPLPATLVGDSPVVVQLKEKLGKLRGQTHLNVLILGESGTGKEVVARLLHQQEPRERPFVVANMPAIPASLMEAELFGVEKGAYTDAKQSRPGRFEMAEGGDLFLDEIGDLAPELQAKLLRALQERRIERLGSTRAVRLEVRVIAATNRPLSELVPEQKFREDLLYRLADVVLRLPPLRERREDIPALARHFIQKHAPQARTVRLSESAMRQLCAYDWPGNVRELESAIKRALVFCEGDEIKSVPIETLWQREPELGSVPPYSDMLAQKEKQVLESTLRRHASDRAKVIQALGLSRATFYRKIKRLGIRLS